MSDPMKIYEELEAKYGKDHYEEIMTGFAETTVAFIRFLADEAQVPFEIMCQALAISEQQSIQEDTP